MTLLLVGSCLSRAITIDFDDLPLGSSANAFGVGGAMIHSTWSIVDAGVVRSTLPGQILAREGGSPAVIASSERFWELVEDGLFGESREEWNDPRNQLQIGVEFLGRATGFSLDAYSLIYSSTLVYSGFDATGTAINGSLTFSGMDYQHLNVQAPEGGYLTGFSFTQEDFWVAPIELRMDNLAFTSVPDAGSAGICLGMALAGMWCFRRRWTR